MTPVVHRLSDLIPVHEWLAGGAPADLTVSGLAHDSRKVTKGNVYFAVKGGSTDGHAFLEPAAKAGAAAFIVEEPELVEKFPNAIQVASTRESLAWAAARWWDHPTQKLKLVGITGTNGKTTTSYLLRSIWEGLGLVTGIVGTVEYQIGRVREKSLLTTPDPLHLQALFHRMVEVKVGYAAIEVSSIALDQARVVGCDFDVGVFTNLTQDHLDYHGDLETYYLAKRKLFRDFPLRAGVINVDDPVGSRLERELGGYPLIGYSLRHSGADVCVRDPRFEKSRTTATLKTPLGEFPLTTPLIGRHNLYNCLAAFSVAYALGQDLPSVLKTLAHAGGAPGRLERVAEAPGRPHVFVDYAHTPDALENVLRALHALRGDTGTRLITVFGCGGDRDKTKRPLMARIACELSDVTVATSDNPRTEDPDAILDDIEVGIERRKTEYHREVNRRAAIELALKVAAPGDLVLVAGKGHETYQIIGREEFPFDDREVIRDYFSKG